MSCVDGDWIADTNTKLTSLLTKYLDAAFSINEAVHAFQKAHDAISECTKADKCSVPVHDNRIQKQIVKGDYMFIAVKSPLYSDGSFWCRVWKQTTAFDDDIIDAINKELGWLEKDTKLEKTGPSDLNIPLFFYSESHGQFLRCIIEKAFDNHVLVRLLDTGAMTEVSRNIQFYKLHKLTMNKFPFLCVQGQLGQDGDIFPYELKWRFNDLTHNQILLAQITDVMNNKPFTCYQMELKSLLTETNITKELLSKLAQNVAEEQRAEEQRAELTRKPEVTDCSIKEDSCKTIKKSLPVIATVGPVHQNITSNVDKLNDTVIGTNSNKHVQSVKVRSRNNSISKSDDGYRHNVTASFDLTNVKTLSRCRSAESVNSFKPTTMAGLTRKIIENVVRQDVCNTKCNGTTSDSEENRTDFVPGEGHMKKYARENIVATTSSTTNERIKVNNAIPTLLNLFYNSTTLRDEPWFEIELMNISNLLNSQARMLFYFYDVSKTKVLNSLKNGGHLELVMFQSSQALYSITEHAEHYSQYLVLRNFVRQSNALNSGRKQHSKAVPFIMGIARLDSAMMNSNGSLPVSYLSLSRCTTSVPEWELVQKSSLQIMNNNKARTIVEWFRRTLASQNRVAIFPEVYPWSGVLPQVKNLKKPRSKKQTRSREMPTCTPTQSPSLSPQPLVNPETLGTTSGNLRQDSVETSEAAGDDINREEIPMLESTISPLKFEEEMWDISDDVKETPCKNQNISIGNQKSTTINGQKDSTTNSQKNATTANQENCATDTQENCATDTQENCATDIQKNCATDIQKNCTTDIQKNCTTDIQESETIDNKKDNQHTASSEAAASPLNSISSTSAIRNKDTDIALCDDNDNQRKNLNVEPVEEKECLTQGYYDQTGMWYPSVVANVVGQALDEVEKTCESSKDGFGQMSQQSGNERVNSRKVSGDVDIGSVTTTKILSKGDCSSPVQTNLQTTMTLQSNMIRHLPPSRPQHHVPFRPPSQSDYCPSMQPPVNGQYSTLLENGCQIEKSQSNGHQHVPPEQSNNNQAAPSMLSRQQLVPSQCIGDQSVQNQQQFSDRETLPQSAQSGGRQSRRESNSRQSRQESNGRQARPPRSHVSRHMSDHKTPPSRGEGNQSKRGTIGGQSRLPRTNNQHCGSKQLDDRDTTTFLINGHQLSGPGLNSNQSNARQFASSYQPTSAKINDRQCTVDEFDNVGRDLSRMREVNKAELLSLISITSDQSSDDNMESVQRFERDCQIFGVSSEDFDT